MTTIPPQPDPASALAATPPGFGPASHRQPSQDPMDPERTTTTEPPDPPGQDQTMGGWKGDPVDADPAEEGPVSSGPQIPKLGSSQVFTPDPEAFEGVIATAVGFATMGVNRKLSPDTNAWLASEVQAHDIAAPLSRIAARHIKLSDKATANDLGDGLEAALATVGYVVASSQQDAEMRQQAAGFQPATGEPLP